jgi:hypothetical protein
MSNHGAYDQGHSQGEMGGYNSYEHPPSAQQPYYSGNSYADSTPAHFLPSAPQSAGYTQGYPKFEGALQLSLNVIINDRKRERPFVSVK